MPKIEKLFTLEISPERFLDACSPIELTELQLLISSPRYQNKMQGNDPADALKNLNKSFKKHLGE